MMKMWAEFSRQNTPNKVGGTAEWPAYVGPNWEYLKLEDDEYDVGADNRDRVCMFWDR